MTIHTCIQALKFSTMYKWNRRSIDRKQVTSSGRDRSWDSSLDRRALTVEQSLACRVATKEVTLSVNMAARLANMTAWSGVFTPTEYTQTAMNGYFQQPITPQSQATRWGSTKTVINRRSTTGSYYKWTSSKMHNLQTGQEECFLENVNQDKQVQLYHNVGTSGS